MIKISEDEIRELEQSYPGITEQIQRFEAMELPPCPQCGSTDTASVQVGIIGRTIYLAGATSKFHLIANGNSKGIFICNACNEQFGPPKISPIENNERKPVFLRPMDKSLLAYKAWVSGMFKALTGKESSGSNITEEQWAESHKQFWDRKRGRR